MTAITNILTSEFCAIFKNDLASKKFLFQTSELFSKASAVAIEYNLSKHIEADIIYRLLKKRGDYSNFVRKEYGSMLRNEWKGVFKYLNACLSEEELNEAIDVWLEFDFDSDFSVPNLIPGIFIRNLNNTAATLRSIELILQNGISNKIKSRFLSINNKLPHSSNVRYIGLFLGRRNCGIRICIEVDSYILFNNSVLRNDININLLNILDEIKDFLLDRIILHIDLIGNHLIIQGVEIVDKTREWKKLATILAERRWCKAERIMTILNGMNNIKNGEAKELAKFKNREVCWIWNINHSIGHIKLINSGEKISKIYICQSMYKRITC